MLLVAILLLIVFVCGAFIMVRSSRRQRAMIKHKPSPPTQSDDVWAKHQLPEDWDEDAGEPDE